LLTIAAGGGMTTLVDSRPERERLGAEERSWSVAVTASSRGR